MGVHKRAKEKKDSLDKKPKSDPRPRIPEGDYEAVCFKAESKPYRGSEKRLYLHFEIIDGPYQGTKLFATYNVKYKSFPIASKYYTDWSIANEALPRRRDRMSATVFKDKLFHVKVRDVKPTYEDGTHKPDMFHYSVVDRIIEKLAGNRCQH